VGSLLLSAHNDDETLFAAFTLLRYQPHVVVCFRSFRMANPDYPGNSVVGVVDYRTREFETEMAMKSLGCTWEQWLHRDDDNRSIRELETSIEELAGNEYEFVFVPAWEEFGNVQHNIVSEIAHDHFPHEKISVYLTYTVEGKSTWGVPHEPEPSWIALKHHALSCYKSQAAHPATRAHFMADLTEYIA
jgi:LmbE family N-acetylglucosaminyl deacetylase